MKKFMNVVLIITYINSYLGCAANRIQNIQYTEIKESMPDRTYTDIDLYVFTHDSSRIIFKSNNYQFKDEMVEGKGSYFDTISRPFESKGEIKISEQKHMQFFYNKIVLMTKGEQDLYIIKTDSTELFFSKRNYIFNRDSLIGLGQVIYHDHRRGKLNKGDPMNRQIALADIAGISTELSRSPDAGSILGGTILLILGIGGVIFVVYLFSGEWIN